MCVCVCVCVCVCMCARGRGSLHKHASMHGFLKAIRSLDWGVLQTPKPSTSSASEAEDPTANLS